MPTTYVVSTIGTNTVRGNYIRAGLPPGSTTGAVPADHRADGVAGALGRGVQVSFAIRNFNVFCVSGSQGSGIRRIRLTTREGRNPEISPGMTPLLARSPVPSGLRKSSCSSHFSGGPTCKWMVTCQPFRLLLSWEALLTTLSGSYLLPLSDRINGHTYRNSTDVLPSYRNVNPIAIILMIPVFDHVIYPALRSIGINYTPIKCIYTGFLFCGLAMLYSAVLQKLIYAKSPCHDNHPSGTSTSSFGRSEGWVSDTYLCRVHEHEWVPRSCTDQRLGYQ